MYLAWNEMRRNKLKFGLIIGVLVMISYLLFFFWVSQWLDKYE